MTELIRNVDNSLPVILVDHQPVDIDNAAKDKVDIQLSGHTHHGQFFPFNLITERIFQDDWGLLKIGNYNLVVSCGFFSFWVRISRGFLNILVQVFAIF